MAAPISVARHFALLTSTDDRKSVLHDIKTSLLSSSLSDRSLITVDAFQILFECLKTTDRLVTQFWLI